MGLEKEIGRKIGENEETVETKMRYGSGEKGEQKNTTYIVRVRREWAKNR